MSPWDADPRYPEPLEPYDSWGGGAGEEPDDALPGGRDAVEREERRRVVFATIWPQRYSLPPRDLSHWANYRRDKP